MNFHKYYVFGTGIEFKHKEFDTRKEAETYMHEICQKNHLQQPECTECDLHERKYQVGNVKFYINRV